MSNQEKEPGTDPQMEYDPISVQLTSHYMGNSGPIIYHRMLSLIDQMVKDAKPDHPDFHVRFARMMFQGVHTNKDNIIARPSQSDIRTLKFLLERFSHRKASSSFDEYFFPKKVDINGRYETYGTDDLDSD